jgi:hypothetical protein
VNRQFLILKMFEIFKYVVNRPSSSERRRNQDDQFEIVSIPDNQPNGKFNRFDVLSETMLTLLLNSIADVQRVPPNDLTELYFLPDPEFDHYSSQEKVPANNQVEAKPDPTPTMDESYDFVTTPLSQSLYCGKIKSKVAIFIKSDGETIFLRNSLCTVYVRSDEEVQAIFSPPGKRKPIR